MNNQLITVRFAIVMKNFMVTFQFETYVEVFFNAYVLNKTTLMISVKKITKQSCFISQEN